MASRAVVMCFGSARPTYNDDVLLDCDVAYMEGTSVIQQTVTAEVGIADTVNTIGTKIAAAVRANVPAGISAIGSNNVLIPSYTKA